jgi:hypothetical protein
MLMSLKFWFGRFSLLLVLPLVLILSLSSCSGNPLSLLTGGGTNVAANTQVGKTNSQTVGSTENYAPSVSIRPNSRVDSIDQSKTENTVGSSEKVTINNNSLWLIIFALIGWILPSPNEIGRWFKSIFTKQYK